MILASCFTMSKVCLCFNEFSFASFYCLGLQIDYYYRKNSYCMRIEVEVDSFKCIALGIQLFVTHPLDRDDEFAVVVVEDKMRSTCLAFDCNLTPLEVAADIDMEPYVDHTLAAEDVDIGRVAIKYLFFYEKETIV